MQKHHQIKINHLVRFDSSEFLYRHEVLFHLMLQIMFGLQKTKIGYLQNTPEKIATSYSQSRTRDTRTVLNLTLTRYYLKIILVIEVVYVQPFVVMTFSTIMLRVVHYYLSLAS